MSKLALFSPESTRIQKDMRSANAAADRVLRSALGVDKGSELALHLADLYASAGSVRRIVERIGRMAPKSRAALRKHLRALDTFVFDISARHRSSLKRPLRAALRKL